MKNFYNEKCISVLKYLSTQYQLYKIILNSIICYYGWLQDRVAYTFGITTN
jgi:hypothetical protein